MKFKLANKKVYRKKNALSIENKAEYFLVLKLLQGNVD